MISRAAKSVVQSLNQRSYHVSKTNFKNLSGNIENTSYNPSKILQQSEITEPCTKEDILPFKNLKYEKLVPHEQSQTAQANAEGSSIGRKVPELDISQAVDRRTATNTLKSISVTGTLAPLGDAVCKLLARIPYEQYLQVAVNTMRTHHLSLLQNRQLSATINKDKVEELKARIKDVLDRIRKKLEELQQQRAKEAASKKEQSKSAEKKDSEKTEEKKEEKGDEKSEEKKEENQEVKPPEKENAKKETQDTITMTGLPSNPSMVEALYMQRKDSCAFADNRTFYSIILKGLRPVFSSASPVTQGKVRMAETGTSDYGDHARNDDYFPQGEEYEEEIGSEGFIRPDYNKHQSYHRQNRFPRVYEED